MTYFELYYTLRRRLLEAEISGAALEARLFLAAASGKRQEELLRDFLVTVPPETEERAQALAERRLAGEPAAYLTGSWGFYGLEFLVEPGVLIPRMDTELLVNRALRLLKKLEAPQVLDLCSGSGCIGCTIARYHSDARVWMIDCSEAAVDVARKNVRLLGLEKRAFCLSGDIFLGPEGTELEGIADKFDLIVCNPPYVPTPELAELDPSVAAFEPELALDGGADGMKFYRAVVEKWTGILEPSGWMIFELGEEMAGPVAAAMRREGYREFTLNRDTLGVDRVLAGRRNLAEDEENEDENHTGEVPSPCA